MNRTYTEQRSVIGGGFNVYTIEESDQWNGTQLGRSIGAEHALKVAECDHYDDETEESIRIGSRWILKSLISRVWWQMDVSGARTLARVEYAFIRSQIGHL